MDKHDEILIRTNTASFKDSNGMAMGFDGDQFLLLIVGFLCSLFLMTALTMMGYSIITAFVTCLFPTALTYIYLKVFLAHKPPHYQSDLLQDWIHGFVYERSLLQKENPYYSVMVREIVRKKIEENKKEAII